MAKVLTTASTMKCVHGQSITFRSTATLRIGGAAVVRQNDLLSTVFACANQTKCVTIVASPTTAVRDGDSPVLVVTGISTNFGACTDVDAGHDLLLAE